MGKNKKAPVDAGTPTGAMGSGLATSFPNQEYTTAPQKRLGISNLLQYGCENGLHLSELVQLTGWTEREIRRVIQQERKAGELILSDNKSGYFLPASEHEVRRFIRSMSNRSREIADVSRAAEDALSRMTGQRLIEGWGNG